MTTDEYKKEYSRLAAHRDRWMRLYARKESGRLASRDEKICAKVQEANWRVAFLIAEYDKSQEEVKKLDLLLEEKGKELLFAKAQAFDRITNLIQTAHQVELWDYTSYVEFEEAVRLQVLEVQNEPGRVDVWGKAIPRPT